MYLMKLWVPSLTSAFLYFFYFPHPYGGLGIDEVMYKLDDP